MNVLIIGSTGMLGSEICENFKKQWIDVSCADRDALELTDLSGHRVNSDGIRRLIRERLMSGVDTVINCAALTDTREIETNAAFRASSFAVNSLVPRAIAETCEEFGIHFVHISTEYVFSEFSAGDVFPITYYSDHKLMAELFVKNAMPSGNYTILRVGCLYGENREKSFVHKFLRNCVKSAIDGNNDVPVVDSLFSTPTSCRFVAQSLSRILRQKMCANGTFSVSPLEAATRYTFAKEILKNAKKLGSWFENISVSAYRPLSDSRFVGTFPQSTVLQNIDRDFVYPGDCKITWRTDLETYMSDHSEHFRSFIEKEFELQKEQKNADKA